MGNTNKYNGKKQLSEILYWPNVIEWNNTRITRISVHSCYKIIYLTDRKVLYLKFLDKYNNNNYYYY